MSEPVLWVLCLAAFSVLLNLAAFARAEDALTTGFSLIGAALSGYVVFMVLRQTLVTV